MSFKFIKIEKKVISKESSDFEENESDNENLVEDEKINQIQMNNYQINNNLSSKKITSQNNVQNLNKEKVQEKEQETNKNIETQFYELTTNGLVDKIKNDYDSIYINQQNDINKFVEKLAKENSELKLEISELNQKIIQLQIKNELNSNDYIYNNNNEFIENNLINKNIEINTEKIGIEKNRIKDEYNYIIQNITSNIISKNIKSLYDTLIRYIDEILKIQKINILLQEENNKLKKENDKIKLNFLEEKNKIVQKIIQIQSETNSDINILNNNKTIENKNLIISTDDNVYLSYIEKIKNLTYEKNKLLSCNYDFFIKINDLTQIIEEKNNIINTQIKQISSYDLKILNLEQELNSTKTKNKEINFQLIKAKEKMDESSFEKNDNNFLEEKIFENKCNIIKKQYENKISQLNKNLDDITQKNMNLNKKNKELKENNENLINDNLSKQNLIDNITQEKNNIYKELTNLKTELQLTQEQLITNENEYETKIKSVKETITTDNNNKNINIDKIKSLINNIYEKLPNNYSNNKNINSNINIFVKNNINEIAKLNEINKQINILNKNEEINLAIKEENEKLKNHIKEIINLTLEKTNIIYIEKLKQDFTNISFEQLFLKIINYIKIFKICYLLQKTKTELNFSEKYITWLNGKNNLEEIKNEINKINEEINEIKNIIKNNSLDFEKKVKNFLSKDEIKVEINNIQKKYEKIITDIFEYFLQYKNYSNDKEYLTLQIPIKNYNSMIENNMSNLSLITQSIESWNIFINNDLNENNNNFFQEIINMTNINNNLEYNNMNDLINSFEENENENETGDERNDNINVNENNSERKINEENEDNENENESQYTLDNKE